MFDLLYIITAAFYGCMAHKAWTHGDSPRPYACLACVYHVAALKPLLPQLLTIVFGGG